MPSPSTSDLPAASPAVHPRLVLSICCLSILLVGMDVTIVNVALPSIERELHSSLSDLQWTIDAYTLVVACFLLLSGSVSDRTGRRRTFQIGLAVFTTGSILCSLAPSIGSLIAFRALQGLGASMLNPVALSIISNTFPEPADRARAVGIWGAVSGISLALGPLLGGALTQTVGWRAVFWINAPIGVAAILLTWRFVPESKAVHARRFDPVGQALVIATLGSLVFAIIEAPRRGWEAPQTLVLFAVAACAFTALLRYEPRREDPLIDLRFFHSFSLSSAFALAVCTYASFGAFLFLNTLFLQQVRGLSAFDSGLCTLPLAAMIMGLAPLSGRMVGRYGPVPSLVIAGVALLGSGLLLTRLSAATTLHMLLVSYLLLGMGLGMINPAITNSAVSGMPRSQAGVAAAITSTGRQVGAALGVAIAGTIVVATLHTTGYVGFAQATHPVWWVEATCGCLAVVLGGVSATGWARGTTAAVATLLQEN